MKSKTESIPLDKIPSFIERKLEEKQKVDQEIKAANDILQNKTVTMEAINEHIQLRDELDKQGRATCDKSHSLIIARKSHNDIHDNVLFYR